LNGDDNLANRTIPSGVNPPAHPAVELRGITCIRSEDAPLRDLTVSFTPGCFHAVRGEARSGKRVLLRLLGLLDTPDSGEVFLSGVSMRSILAESRPELRARRFGFVFAAPFLLSSFSVIENVAMPLFKVSQVTPEEARLRTEAVLAFVGLGEQAQASIDNLSIDAQYRAALARGLVHEPPILLVEDLDSTLAGDELCRFTELLRRVSDEMGMTVIATASPALTCKSSDRVLEIAEGFIRRDSELLPEPGA
jgi:ABC-type lipoprotein export system ATPase subunit